MDLVFVCQETVTSILLYTTLKCRLLDPIYVPLEGKETVKMENLKNTQ